MPRIVVAGSENDTRVAVIDFTGAPSVAHVDPGFASGVRVAIDGTTIAVGAVLTGRVGVIDASTPSAPVMLGFVDTTLGGTGAIAIKGNLVAVGEYVNSFQARVKLIDISTPTAPVVLGTAATVLTNVTVPHPEDPADTSAAIGSLAFIGTRVVVVSGPSDFIVVQIDFTTPGSPVVTTWNPVISGGVALDGDMGASRVVVGDMNSTLAKLFNASTHAQVSSTANTTLSGVGSIALAAPLAFAGSPNDPHVARVDFSTGTATISHFDPGLGGGSTTAIEGTVGACGDILGTNVKLFNLATTPPSLMGTANTALASISTLAISTTPAGPPPGAHVAATPPSLTFTPASRVGTTSVAASLSLSNSGSTPLTLNGIASTSAAFAVTPTGNRTVTFGTPLVLSVTFTPGAEGTIPGSITMSTNDAAHPTFTVPLSGVGALPHLTVTPTGSITIPPAPYCLGSQTTITLHNSGGVPLSVTGASIAASFSVTPTSVTVPPSGTGTLTVHFSGPAPTSGSAMLTFASDDPAHPTTTIPISATLVAAPPAITVAPTALSFGAVPVQFFVGLRVAITNASPCEALNVTLTTSGDPYFVTATDPTTLPPGSTTITGTVPPSTTVKFVVVLAPQTATSLPGTLTITSNDPTRPTTVVPLTGSGVMASPISMELVLDRSGSMSGAAQGGTKMQALISAVGIFNDLVVTGRGDEMGSVEFDDMVADLTALGDFTTAKHDAIRDDTALLTPRGATSIGGGMERASSNFAASTLARKVMLVFTDGMENSGATIAHARSVLAAGVEVYAVALGQPTNISTAGLSAAAVTTGGRFFLTDDALILRKNFVQVLADAFRLSMAADPVITLSPGERIEVPVAITQCEYRISFIVSWDDPSSRIDLTVIAPDGTRFDAGSPLANRLVRFVEKPRYRTCQIAFPPVDPGSGAAVIGPPQLGTWRLVLDATSLAGSSERCTTSVMVESDLNIQSRVSAPDVASPFRVDTRLTHLGAPVTDAEVKVTLTMPVTSLSAAMTPAVVHRALDADLRPLAAGGKPTIRTRTKTFHAKPVDKAIFALTLPAPEVDGVYQVEVQAKGRACSGVFERYEAFSVYVGRKANRKRTIIRVAPGKEGNAVSVLVVPRDKQGTLLGPTLAGRISVTLEGGMVSPVIDRLDGSYAVRATWPPKLRKAIVVVRIDEVVVEKRLELRRPTPRKKTAAGAPKKVKKVPREKR